MRTYLLPTVTCCKLYSSTGYQGSAFGLLPKDASASRGFHMGKNPPNHAAAEVNTKLLKIWEWNVTPWLSVPPSIRSSCWLVRLSWQASPLPCMHGNVQSDTELIFLWLKMNWSENKRTRPSVLKQRQNTIILSSETAIQAKLEID